MDCLLSEIQHFIIGYTDLSTLRSYVCTHKQKEEDVIRTFLSLTQDKTKTYKYIVKYRIEYIKYLTSDFVISLNWLPFYYLLEHSRNLFFHGIDDKAQEFIHIARQLLQLYKETEKLHKIFNVSFFVVYDVGSNPVRDVLVFEPFFDDLLELLIEIRNKKNKSLINISLCTSCCGIISEEIEDILLDYLTSFNNLDNYHHTDFDIDTPITTYLVLVKSKKIRDYIYDNYTLGEINGRKYSSEQLFLLEDELEKFDFNYTYAENAHLLHHLNKEYLDRKPIEPLFNIVIEKNALDLIPYLRKRTDYYTLRGYKSNARPTSREAVLFAIEEGVRLSTYPNQHMFDVSCDTEIANGISLQRLYEKHQDDGMFFKYVLQKSQLPLKITLDDLTPYCIKLVLELIRRGYNISIVGEVENVHIVDDPDIVLLVKDVQLPLIVDPICEIPLHYDMNEEAYSLNYDDIPQFVKRMKQAIEGKIIFKNDMTSILHTILKYLRQDKMTERHQELVELINTYLP